MTVRLCQGVETPPPKRKIRSKFAKKRRKLHPARFFLSLLPADGVTLPVGRLSPTTFEKTKPPKYPMKLLTKMLSLLGALAIAGGTCLAADCEKECPGKKKDKEEPTLAACKCDPCKCTECKCAEKKEGALADADCGKCKGGKKDGKEAEGEGTILAGPGCGKCKGEKKDGEEAEGTLVADGCKDGCKKKKECEDEEEGTVLAGSCKDGCKGKKKDGEEEEGTVLAGSCKDGCKGKKKDGEEEEGTVLAGSCKDGCKGKKKDGEEEEEGTLLAA